jgi:uncharacterized protein (TIGR02453 family)
MAKPFGGFHEEGMRFLSQLASNNTREWFQEHKGVYESSVKGPMLALVESVNVALQEFAPEYIAAEPAKALSRINRDTRFSKDKSPYRTSLSAVFPRGGAEKHEVAGFFFGISPEGVEVVGGAYMPGPDQLQRLRACFAEQHAEFRKLVKARGLTSLMGDVQGEQLQRVPRDFDPAHPAGDLLRYKQVFFRAHLEPALITTSKLEGELVKRFKAMTPVMHFLDAALAAPLRAGKAPARKATATR